MLEQSIKEKLISVFKKQCENIDSFDVITYESSIGAPVKIDIDLSGLTNNGLPDLTECGYKCIKLNYSKTESFSHEKKHLIYFKYKNKPFEITPVFPVYSFEDIHVKFSFKNFIKHKRKMLDEYLMDIYKNKMINIYYYYDFFYPDDMCFTVDDPKFIIRYNKLYSELTIDEYQSLIDFYTDYLDNRDLKALIF